MSKHLVFVSLLASASSFAANFGAPGQQNTPESPNKPPLVTTPAPVSTAAPLGGGLFRVVKADGATVIQQGNLQNAALEVINVSEKDAIASANGRCAFNVKYDVLSSALASVTNRLFSNDAAVAVNSNVALSAGVVKTVWTQPYLFAGMNNVRVVVNADSAAPITKWIRVNVDGSCGGKAASTPATTPNAPTTPVNGGDTPPKPPLVVIQFKPGSGEWNNLNNIWGYSNYGVTQLKGKGFGRYDELARLNAAVTGFINAKVVDQGAYNSLMTSWNTFVTDPAFKAAMSAPPTVTDKPQTTGDNKVPPAPAAVVVFKPGSGEWNNLNNVWGYSNYGVTQLKGKAYGRYNDLAKLNAAVTSFITAKVVDQGAYNSLMTAWNSFVNDPAFKAAMAAVVPAKPGQI